MFRLFQKSASKQPTTSMTTSLRSKPKFSNYLYFKEMEKEAGLALQRFQGEVQAIRERKEFYDFEADVTSQIKQFLDKRAD